MVITSLTKRKSFVPSIRIEDGIYIILSSRRPVHFSVAGFEYQSSCGEPLRPRLLPVHCTALLRRTSGGLRHHRPGTGDYHRPGTGDYHRPGTGDYHRTGTGDYHRTGTGDYHRTGTGDYHRPGTGDYHRPGTGDYHRTDTGDYHRTGTGDYHRTGTGDYHRTGTGDYHRTGTGDYHRTGTGDYHRPGTGDYHRPGTGDYHRPGTGDYHRTGTGDYHRTVRETGRTAEYGQLSGDGNCVSSLETGTGSVSSASLSPPRCHGRCPVTGVEYCAVKAAAISVTFPNRLRGGGAECEKCSRYHANSAEIGFLFSFDPSLGLGLGGGGDGPSQRDIKLRPWQRQSRLDFSSRSLLPRVGSLDGEDRQQSAYYILHDTEIADLRNRRALITSFTIQR